MDAALKLADLPCSTPWMTGLTKNPRLTLHSPSSRAGSPRECLRSPRQPERTMTAGSCRSYGSSAHGIPPRPCSRSHTACAALASAEGSARNCIRWSGDRQAVTSESRCATSPCQVTRQMRAVPSSDLRHRPTVLHHHNYVRRLDVPMDEPLLVRMLDRRTDVAEEPVNSPVSTNVPIVSVSRHTGGTWLLDRDLAELMGHVRPRLVALRRRSGRLQNAMGSSPAPNTRYD